MKGIFTYHDKEKHDWASVILDVPEDMIRKEYPDETSYAVKDAMIAVAFIQPATAGIFDSMTDVEWMKKNHPEIKEFRLERSFNPAYTPMFQFKLIQVGL